MTGRRLTSWQLITFFGMLSSAGLSLSLWIQAQGTGLFATSWKWQLGGLSLVFLFFALTFGFAASWSPFAARMQSYANRFLAFLRRFGVLNLLVVGGAAGVLLVIGYFPEIVSGIPQLFNSLAIRIGLAGTLACLATPFTYSAFRKVKGIEAGILTLLVFGVLYRVFYFIPAVSDTPLTLGWSEGSRYYYASLFFAGDLYNLSLPWPFLHPSRYFLMSLPHLIDGLPIWAHRLWQVILWIGLSGVTAWLFARRLKLPTTPLTWMAGLWGFLFLFQGAVYYHLLVCVILVLAGFNPKHFWRSVVVVVLASAWAGFSRVNWFPVPAFLAIGLYLLETPVNPVGRWWFYLRNPIVWAAAGGLTALSAQAGYIILSRQPDLSAFGSSFTSDLLWYRLMPNATYAPGILPMILLISAPLLSLILLNLQGGRYHPLRLLGLFGMLIVLFLGGLVVSVKIGGGSNLHNLDAYLVVLLIWGGYLLSGRVTPESLTSVRKLPSGILALVVVIPFVPLLMDGGTLTLQTREAALPEVEVLRQEVEAVSNSGGEVLFMWQRQLLTFGELQGVKLIPEYETIELMEMAMAGNRPYLDRFHEDLRTKRFELIVTNIKNPAFIVGERQYLEEHNAWVEHVTLPLLQYYQPVRLLSESWTELYVPKP